MKAPGGLPREPIPHCGAPAANPHMAGAPFRPTRSDVPSRVASGNPANGHYGLDIAADPGSTVRAAAAGTVTFAGWKNNGGGYQVWIAHGSGLYTTYNHMSAVSVGVGQGVRKAQQVGRVGSSGYATGPHLHFEVWRGPIWNGGTRINPLAYL